MSIITKKICLIGDFGVGKTSLIRRFVEQQFSEQYLSTIGVTISRKIVNVSQNNHKEQQSIQLLIWDIEGKTQFKKISPIYLKSAQGVIIVADMSRMETVDNISSHLNLAVSVNTQGIPLIFVLNKVDLVAEDLLQTLLKQSPIFKQFPTIPVYCTSAKTGQNVETIFFQLAQSIIKKN